MKTEMKISSLDLRILMLCIDLLLVRDLFARVVRGAVRTRAFALLEMWLRDRVRGREFFFLATLIFFLQIAIRSVCERRNCRKSARAPARKRRNFDFQHKNATNTHKIAIIKQLQASKRIATKGKLAHWQETRNEESHWVDAPHKSLLKNASYHVSCSGMML